MSHVEKAFYEEADANAPELFTVYYAKTFFQKLFGLKQTVKSYIYKDGEWYNNETKKRVSQKEWFMLQQLDSSVRPSVITHSSKTTRGRSRSRNRRN